MLSDWFTPPGEKPAAVVAHDGRLQTGHFDRPPQQLNFRDARLLARRTLLPRLVEWYGVGMAHPDWYFAVIVVQAERFSLMNLYGVDRHSREMFSHDVIATPRHARVAESPWGGETTFDRTGAWVRMRHDLAAHKHTVDVDLRAGKNRPAVRGQLVWHEDPTRSPALVALAPMGERRFIYNHKAQMPISGTLRVGNVDVTFAPDRDLANLDEVRACLGVRNHYRWVNFSGFDDQARIIGLNASDSRQRHASWGSENAMWLGAKLSFVGEVEFDLDPHDLMRPWRIRDRACRIDVTFTPEGGKSVAVGPLGAYHQKCGTFSGVLRDERGAEHSVNRYVGCCESVAVL